MPSLIPLIQAIIGYFQRDWTFDVTINQQFLPIVREHFKQFFFGLMMLSISSTFGACSKSDGMIGTCIACCWFLQIPLGQRVERLYSLASVAYFGWRLITPWLSYWLGVDRSLIVSLVFATSVGFGSMYGASKWVPLQRVHSINSSEFLCLLPNPRRCHCNRTKNQAYGILVYNVATYSQEVALRASLGDEDYVSHALCLYTALEADSRVR